jgi:hypothetical protein
MFSSRYGAFSPILSRVFPITTIIKNIETQRKCAGHQSLLLFTHMVGCESWGGSSFVGPGHSLHGRLVLKSDQSEASRKFVREH